MMIKQLSDRLRSKRRQLRESSWPVDSETGITFEKRARQMQFLMKRVNNDFRAGKTGKRANHTCGIGLTYTCARYFKFSPDPDQTKTRPKPEKNWFNLNRYFMVRLVILT